MAESAAEAHQMGRHASTHPEDMAFWGKTCPECATKAEKIEARSLVLGVLLKSRDSGTLSDLEYREAFNAVNVLSPVHELVIQ